MRSAIALLLASTLALAGCSGKSAELETPPARDGLAQPADLAWWSRAAIDAFMRFSAWRGAQSGYIAVFARDGVPVYGNAAGFKDIATGQPMAMDTPVRIASMTKPVTAVAAMILVEEGKLSLDDPVAALFELVGERFVAQVLGRGGGVGHVLTLLVAQWVIP